MLKYYFKNQPNGIDRYIVIATIEDRYYWLMEWSAEAAGADALIHDFHAGFLSDSIREKCKTLEEISHADLRSRFDSFAYYIERAVNGFKSYILWISPDSTTTEISWKIPLN